MPNVNWQPPPIPIRRVWRSDWDRPIAAAAGLQHAAPRGENAPAVTLPDSKQTLCLAFSRGTCTWGDRCLHAHGDADLKRQVLAPSPANQPAGPVHPRFNTVLASARRARANDEVDRALWRYEEAITLLEPAADAGLPREKALCARLLLERANFAGEGCAATRGWRERAAAD